MTCSVMGCQDEGQARLVPKRIGPKLMTVSVVICDKHWSSPDTRLSTRR